jgi:hypothetical protein
MYELLYGSTTIDRRALRAFMREQVCNAKLIPACAAGQRSAVHALLSGFWPFVDDFEKAIDRQVAGLPIKPLVKRFGRERTHSFFNTARNAVREMREEEGSHALLWQEGAQALVVNFKAYDRVPGVEQLIASSTTRDPVAFFCWLAGTEYIAEEMAAYLCKAPRFLELFPDRRWRWGEAHLEAHNGPSHLEIDEDLARAYHPSDDDEVAGKALWDGIVHCQQMFARAAADVFDRMQTFEPAEPPR